MIFHDCCEDAEMCLVYYDNVWRFEDDCGKPGPDVFFCPFCGMKLQDLSLLNDLPLPAPD